MLTVEKLLAAKALLSGNEVPITDRIMYYKGIMYRDDGLVKNAGTKPGAEWRLPTVAEVTDFRLLLQDES